MRMKIGLLESNRCAMCSVGDWTSGFAIGSRGTTPCRGHGSKKSALCDLNQVFLVRETRDDPTRDRSRPNLHLLYCRPAHPSHYTNLVLSFNNVCTTPGSYKHQVK